MSAVAATPAPGPAGHPNSGKTALFNLLTGSRQKVANYAGVTVERKEGLLTTPLGHQVRVLDLPGAYSLNALSADEAVTRDVITGRRAGESAPTCWCAWSMPPTCNWACAWCLNRAPWACPW